MNPKRERNSERLSLSEAGHPVLLGTGYCALETDSCHVNAHALAQILMKKKKSAQVLVKNTVVIAPVAKERTIPKKREAAATHRTPQIIGLAPRRQSGNGKRSRQTQTKIGENNYVRCPSSTSARSGGG